MHKLPAETCKKGVKIAHLADVHWRSLSRHAEYRRVFEAFAEDARRRGVNHIFVGGDIFHTKTSGLSPEYIDVMAWWLGLLVGVVEPLDGAVHLTLGNHDGNLVNMSRQDAVTPIVAALGSPRIKVYKKSGVYQFAPGFNWCVFSLFDRDGWQNVKPVPGQVNIACYHGPVQGAVSESNWAVDGEIDVSFFADYDFCLLGDIHATQFLAERECVIEVGEGDFAKYPGARPVQG